MALRSFLQNSRCTGSHRSPLISRSWISRPSRTSLSVPVGYPCQFHTQQHARRNVLRFGAFRMLSSASTSLPPAILADPARTSLFYHFIIAPNPLSKSIPAYAVSFLEHPPKDPHGPAVLGWLPAAASSSEGEEAGLGDFKENPKFIHVLHEVIQKAIEEGSDERLNAEALQRGDGWMHVNDDRNVPAVGRISSPDDIIASVMVQDGQIIPQTYSPMPAYRVCTTDGLTTLPEKLQFRLLEELKRREKGDREA